MATQVTPSAAVRRESLEGLAPQGLKPSGEVHWNFVAPELVEAAIRRGEGRLAEMGPFVAVTSPHTGRSPNDKFVVQESSSEADVDWGKVNQPISEAHFDVLLADLDPTEPFPVSELGTPRGRQGAPRKKVVLPEGWLDDTDGRGSHLREDADETTGG